VSTTVPETKFSIYKPFTAYDYLDYLFRAKPEGARITISQTTSPSPGVSVIEEGVYRKGENIHYVFQSGSDLLAKLDENTGEDGTYYPDDLAYLLTSFEISVKFAGLPKQGGPF